MSFDDFMEYLMQILETEMDKAGPDCPFTEVSAIENTIVVKIGDQVYRLAVELEQ